MTFLMLEIAWYLLGAAAIGLFIGWAWQSLQAKADEKALELNWRKRYEGERLSLRGVETELEAAAIQLGDLRADHRHAMAKVDNLKIAVEDRDEEIEQLSAALETAREQAAGLTGELAQQRELTGAESQRADELSAANEALGARLQDLKTENAGLSRSLEEQRATTRGKDEEIATLTAANENLAAAMAQGEEQLARLDAEHQKAVDGLRGLSDSSARQEARLAILEAALADRDRRITEHEELADGLTGERDAALQAKADARAAGEALEQSLEQTAAGLEAERAESTRRQQACRRLEDLDAERTRRIGELEQRLAQATALGQRHVAEIADLKSRHEQDLAAARASARAPAAPQPVSDERLRDLKARHETAVAGLTSRLQDAQTELERLRRRLTQVNNVATAPVLHKTVSAPPAMEDDLTRISGIGKVLEKKLKQLGITRYRDVAMLADDQRREQVAASLGAFRGRITRDNWADQASRLHQAKYGEHPDA